MSIDCSLKADPAVSFETPAAVIAPAAAIAPAKMIMIEASTIPRGVPASLWNRAVTDPIDRTLSRPGKRIRETVLDCAYQLSGGQDAAPRALIDAVEILHAGSLIVDDIEDGSTLRRGVPALHCSVGVPLAINTGNWMYFYALQQLASLPVTIEAQAAISFHCARVVRECHEGQALDLAARVSDLRPFEVSPVVDAISRLKTGGLISLAAWLGGMTADASSDTLHSLEKFGMRIGIGLQMLNDLNTLRASIASPDECDDLRNGRVTWAWAWLSNTVPTDDFLELQQRASHAVQGVIDRNLAADLYHRIEAYGREAVHEAIWGAFESLEGTVGECPATLRLKDMLQQLEQS